MTIDDGTLNYYIKRINSEMYNRFPELVGSEFNQTVQDTIDGWVEKVSSYEPPSRMCIGDMSIPENPDHTVVETLVGKLKKASRSFDDSVWMSRCVFEGDNSELVKELLEEMERMNSTMGQDATAQYLNASMDALMNKICNAMDVMAAIEPGCRAVMWGNSPASFTYSQQYDVKRYSSVFKNNRKVRELTDMLGRKDDVSFTQKGTMAGFDGNIRDEHFGTEIMGLRLGKEIENLVPSELVSLMDQDLSTIFDMKYIEGRLMSFSREDEIETDVDENGDLDAADSLGPVIMIADTSGSMMGTPLFYAKALGFTIATRAAELDRDVYRIDFNTITKCVNMSPKTSFKELLSFLATDGGGGTDPGPALKEAINMTETNRYRFADIVVISDFYLDMGNFDRDNPTMLSLRSRGCRVHSISIPVRFGSFSDDFDSCWGISKLHGKLGSGMFDRITADSFKKNRRKRS